MKAKQLIKKLVSKYERCSTYQDQGYFVDTSGRTWFKSYFTRPNRLVFTTSTVQENLHEERLGDRIIWWNEGRIFEYWSPQFALSSESRVQKLTSPFNSISRLACCALALLGVPELSAERCLFENEFRFLDENVETIQLVSDLKPVVSLEVHIEKVDFRLRKVRLATQDFRWYPGQHDLECVYEKSTFDAHIPEHLFSFEPPAA